MKSLTIALLFFGCLLTATPATGQDDSVDFVKQIKPILEKHCLSCHMGEDAESVDLTVSEEAMDYIEAEDAEGSHLFELLVSEDEDELMPPPDEENPLSSEQIELIKNWINQGASWPEDVSFTLPQDPDNSDAATDDETAPGADGQNAADSTDEADNNDKTNEVVYKAIGSLHPAAVHIPVGLLLAAGLFALLGIRGNFVMSDCAYYCLWLGVLGAIAACVSGWWSVTASQGQVSQVADLWDLDQKVFWHRTSGIVATAFALVLALFAASARAKDPDDGVLWKLGLMVLAAGIGYVGFAGGKLTHGPNHYKYLNQLMGEVAPDLFGQPVNDDNDGDETNRSGSEDSDGDDQNGEQEGSGQSSEEATNVGVQQPRP